VLEKGPIGHNPMQTRMRFTNMRFGFMLKMILKSIQTTLKSNYKSDQKSDQKILLLMKENSKITINELCSIVSMSESGVKKVIRKLKDEERLTRAGSLKAGYWEVKE